MPDLMRTEGGGVMGSTSAAPDGKDLLNPATAVSAAPANLRRRRASPRSPARRRRRLPPLDTSAATSVLNLAHMVTTADAASTPR